MRKFNIQDWEAGNVICSFASLEEAEKENWDFTENFYEIVEIK